MTDNYNIDFPMFSKIEVNGDGRHPLYEQLTPVADAEGRDGDIQWNFEKFLVGRDGTVLARDMGYGDDTAAFLDSLVSANL